MRICDKMQMQKKYADVAELADAQVSGTCERNLLGVQISSSAPLILYNKMTVKNCHFFDITSLLKFIYHLFNLSQYLL